MWTELNYYFFKSYIIKLCINFTLSLYGFICSRNFGICGSPVLLLVKRCPVLGEVSRAADVNFTSHNSREVQNKSIHTRMYED